MRLYKDGIHLWSITLMKVLRPLYPETLRLLQRIHRQSRHHQVRQRAQFLLLVGQGWTIGQLLKIFSVTHKTLYNWLDAWEERGIIGLYNRPGRGRKGLFNQEQKEQIKAWAKKNPKNLKRIRQKIKEEWDLIVSQDTIKRILKALGMSWHRLKRGVGGQPDPAEYEAKRQILEEFKKQVCQSREARKEKKKSVIVMDQASIHTSDEIVYEKQAEWLERGVELFWLPTYSPELNLIEILWRFIKYEWIEISAYKSWGTLIEYVERVLKEFGQKLVINFA